MSLIAILDSTNMTYLVRLSNFFASLALMTIRAPYKSRIRLRNYEFRPRCCAIYYLFAVFQSEFNSTLSSVDVQINYAGNTNYCTALDIILELSAFHTHSQGYNVEKSA